MTRRQLAETPGRDATTYRGMQAVSANTENNAVLALLSDVAEVLQRSEGKSDPWMDDMVARMNDLEMMAVVREARTDKETR